MLLPYRRMRSASAFYTFILEDFWTEVGLKASLEFTVFGQIVLVFVEYLFISRGNFTTEIFKMLYLW
jgi:hypothetical protein